MKAATAAGGLAAAAYTASALAAAGSIDSGSESSNSQISGEDSSRSAISSVAYYSDSGSNSTSSEGTDASCDPSLTCCSDDELANAFTDFATMFQLQFETFRVDPGTTWGRIQLYVAKTEFYLTADQADDPNNPQVIVAIPIQKGCTLLPRQVLNSDTWTTAITETISPYVTPYTSDASKGTEYRIRFGFGIDPDTGIAVDIAYMVDVFTTGGTLYYDDFRFHYKPDATEPVQSPSFRSKQPYENSETESTIKIAPIGLTTTFDAWFRLIGQFLCGLYANPGNLWFKPCFL
jgi:hypothetical protein